MGIAPLIMWFSMCSTIAIQSISVDCLFSFSSVVLTLIKSDKGREIQAETYMISY